LLTFETAPLVVYTLYFPFLPNQFYLSYTGCSA
jgi:hypothetical protein